MSTAAIIAVIFLILLVLAGAFLAYHRSRARKQATEAAAKSRSYGTNVFEEYGRLLGSETLEQRVEGTL